MTSDGQGQVQLAIVSQLRSWHVGMDSAAVTITYACAHDIECQLRANCCQPLHTSANKQGFTRWYYHGVRDCLLQARLSGPYIRRWITGGDHKQLTLEDPVDGVLRPGQIIGIKAPTKRGQPIHIAIQAHGAALPPAAVRCVSSDAAGMSVYALCVTILLPVGEDNVCGKLSIGFEEGNDSTAHEVTLTG